MLLTCIPEKFIVEKNSCISSIGDTITEQVYSGTDRTGILSTNLLPLQLNRVQKDQGYSVPLMDSGPNH